ncbi:MAG: pilus assembly protein [Bacilli bacterium]|nr:pilus assembly protein [Bacilli bacterium]
MNRKGQALVEFVLILPIFIFILFVIVDFGTILSKKNELENVSVDVVSMIKNNDTIIAIKKHYPELQIDIEEDEKYIVVTISENIDIITPGLNRVFGDPYEIVVERTIPNV